MIKLRDMVVLIEKPRSRLLDEIVERNLYELDLTLWCLLKDLAYQRPEIAARQFQISQRTARQIAHADLAILRKLASKEFCSFELNTSETALLAHLEQPYPLAPLPNDLFKEPLGTMYWLILNQVAKQDIGIACLYFGVSPCLAKAIMRADYNQLIRLANTIPLQFSLSCTEQSVLDCLANDDIQTFLKKQFTILKKRLK